MEKYLPFILLAVVLFLMFWNRRQRIVQAITGLVQTVIGAGPCPPVPMRAGLRPHMVQNVPGQSCNMAVPDPVKQITNSSYQQKQCPCSIRHDGYGFYFNNTQYHGQDHEQGKPYCDLPSY